MIGLKISKQGYNVLTTGNANLTFNSEIATHSIYNIIQSSITSGNSSITINHNLGYIPKVWIFVVLNDGSNDYFARIPRADVFFNGFDYYITSTTIVIQRNFTSGTSYFRVIIFTRAPTL